MAATRSKRIQEHQVWTDLGALDEVLAESELLLVDTDSEIVSAHASLLALAKHTRVVLKSLNPILVPESQLEAVRRSIEGIYNSVTAGINQQDPSQLVTALTQAEPLLATLAVLPVVRSKHDTAGMTEAISQFHQYVDLTIDDVRARADTLREEIEALDEHRVEIASVVSAQKDALATTISGFEDQITTAIGEFQEQIATEQQKQATENTAAFQAVQTKLDAAITQATAYYDEDDDRHEEQVKRFDTEFEALKTEIDTAAKEAASTTAAQAKEMIKNLQEHLDTAKSLVEMIGEVTMTGHYQKNASEQKKAADNWRIATVVVTALTVAWAVGLAAYGLSHRADRDWFDYVSRIGVTVTLAALAGYLGTQARTHRRRETNYRALELELATLDPFLSSMSDDERHRIKAHLAMRYFIGVDPDATAVTLEELPRSAEA